MVENSVKSVKALRGKKWPPQRISLPPKRGASKLLGLPTSPHLRPQTPSRIGDFSGKASFLYLRQARQSPGLGSIDAENVWFDCTKWLRQRQPSPLCCKWNHINRSKIETQNRLTQKNDWDIPHLGDVSRMETCCTCKMLVPG